MDLLLIKDENKSYYACIKDLNRFTFNITKYKYKNKFWRYCLQCFGSEKAFQEHREICLIINGKQSVKLKKGKIRLKNYFKQIAVQVKIYINTESNLAKKIILMIETKTLHILKNIKIVFLVVLLINLNVLMMNLAS